MRLITYRHNGEARLGALLGDRVVDLNQASQGALPPQMLSFLRAGPAALDRARALLQGYSGPSLALSEVKLLAPIPRTPKNVIALGLNYADHVAEGARARGREVKLPEHPIYFTKAATSINHPDEPIVFSRRWTEQVDWEVELAVVIGVGGRDIPKERVFDHIAGYMVGNDVSAREVQRNHQQFYRGKSLDTFCPLGPWLVTRDEIPDPHNLRLTLRVNGVTKQDSNTRYMIFDIPTTISVLSLGQTLEPGDVILTGTPDGVGFARTPPEFLKHGDVVEAEIEGIGVLRNPVVEIP